MSITRYKNYVYLSAYTSASNDNNEGVYRVTVDPHTGELGSVTQVDTAETRSVDVFGRRLHLFGGGSGWRVQDIRSPATWNPSDVVTLAPAGYTYVPKGGRAAAAGPFVYAPALTSGTYLYELSFADTSPWMPDGVATRAVFGSSFAEYITIAGDRVFVSNRSGRPMEILRLR